MFDTIKRWAYYWKLSRQAKQNLKKQIEQSRKLPPHEPPTAEEVKKFMEEFDMGWNSHMIQRVEPKKTYYEAEI